MLASFSHLSYNIHWTDNKIAYTSVEKEEYPGEDYSEPTIGARSVILNGGRALWSWFLT
jgi:hypothetical protein